MVDNPTKIYNDYVRANLPNSMSYDTGTDRYDINSHSFFKFKNSNWYFNYISKYGYSALTAYAVNGLEPALVFDFKGNYFRKGSSASTFGASITHAATTNATMVDSDGLLKWRPHNRVTSSGDLTGTGWSTVRATYDGPTETLTQVSTTVQGIVTQAPASLTVGARYKYTIRMKAGNTGWGVVAHVITYPQWIKTWFDLSNGVVGTVGANTTATIVNAGDGWWDCSVEAVATVTSANISAQIAASDNTTTAADGDTVLVRQVHAHRSDLGGMVNNPDTTSSYVPTTTAPVYLSRRGHHIYNGSAWVNEGILHESEARTNLVTYSNDFTTSSWTRQLVSIASNVSGVTAPDGSETVDKMIPYSSNNEHRVWDGVSSTAVGETYSVYAKSAGYDYVWLGYYEGSVYGYAVVNLTNGVVTASNTANYSVEASTNGFYRISVTKTASGTNPRYISISPSPTASPTLNSSNVPLYTGDGTSGIYVYGAQVEAGSTPSSYIPTTGATVTRAAEALTVPAANLPYNSTNMSIQMDGKMTYADRNLIREVQFVEWLADSNNGIEQFACSGTGFFPNGAVSFFQEAAATTSLRVTPAATLPFGVNVPFNISSRHGSTFLNGAVGGTALTTDTTPTALPNLSSTDLNLGFDFMGTIGEFRMWSDDLGDVGITEATLPSTEPSLSLTFDGSETSFIVLDWSE